MYVPAHAREERPSILYEAIEKIRFGSLVTCDGGRLSISHVPMMADAQAGIIRGHLARANPQWRVAAGSQAVASFVGPHFYVSPNDYASTAQTGKNVPTWNYIAVQARGTVTFFDDRDRLLQLVCELTDRAETDRDVPWHVNDAPAEFIELELRGIIGFELRVGEIVGAWKLSRNHHQADRESVAHVLDESDDPALRDLAARVRAE